jgi:hypothetical protein
MKVLKAIIIVCFLITAQYSFTKTPPLSNLTVFSNVITSVDENQITIFWNFSQEENTGSFIILVSIDSSEYYSVNQLQLNNELGKSPTYS